MSLSAPAPRDQAPADANPPASVTAAAPAAPAPRSGTGRSGTIQPDLVGAVALVVATVVLGTALGMASDRYVWSAYRIDVTPVRAEWDALIEEMRSDPNQGHFQRTDEFDIDLSGMADDSSISTLLGSAPGLIGSDRPLLLHELRRAPWEVVVLRGVDTCAPAVRDTVAAALDAGTFTDAMGRRIPLGAALVILTAPGVGTGGDAPAAAALAARLGPVLVGACDVVCGSTSTAAAGARWAGRTARSGRLTDVRLVPRYLPDWAGFLARVPGLREVVCWNLVVVGRRRS